MTGPGARSPTPHLANLCYDLAQQVGSGAITTAEAIAGVAADRTPYASAAVPALAEEFRQLAATHREVGSLATALVHEWAVAHAPGDRAAVFASGLGLVRAATEVLVGRDDADLYRRACAAAGRMAAIAGPATAGYAVGMLHLAPYAFDPVDSPDDYPLAGLRRVLRASSGPIHVPRKRLLPEPAAGLDLAVRHLAAAAEGATGPDRGEILAHLAFAAYSRHLAGGADGPTGSGGSGGSVGGGACGGPADIDRWCAEAAALLPPTDRPLAGNRLMLLCLLRGRVDLVAGRDLVVVRDGLLPDGLLHTVLAGITAVRAFDLGHRLDACGELARATRRLATNDPDLDAQRLYLDLAAGHSLPGDPLGCTARRQPAPPPSQPLTGAAVAADRIHALLCGPRSDESGILAAWQAVRAHAPHLSGLLRLITAHWNWITAFDAGRTGDDREALWLVHAVNSLARDGSREVAVLALSRLADVLGDRLADGADIDRHDLAVPVWAMAGTVYARLSEADWRTVRACLWMLLTHWSVQETRAADERVLLTMAVLKGPGLSAALARPGPAAPDPAIARALAGIEAGGGAEPPAPMRDMILTGYLHSAEREPGATAGQRRANLRRRAQLADNARLMAGAGELPVHGMEEIRAALPDDAALLSVCNGGVGGTGDGMRMVLLPRRGTMYVAGADISRGSTSFGGTRDYLQTGMAPEGADGATAVHSWFAAQATYLRQALLEEPLHGAVSRNGATALRLIAQRLRLGAELAPPLAETAEAGHTRLLVWPHEALYFIPFQLLPFQDGVLADRFTVTVVPSMECLFAPPPAAAAPGVTAMACAAGGVPAGLPEEPSVHRQAERIAAMFGGRPLIGDEATVPAALRVLGTTRYLHLAAHGTQDADAPLFARVHLAGGALHAHQILGRDLRGTELVTLSACESALLRYDFLDNGHGLAPAFLRAGARAVIGALWPVAPDAAETFFTELYARLAAGGTRVDAFRLAQHRTRARHPDYRDWGAFTYYGS